MNKEILLFKKVNKISQVKTQYVNVCLVLSHAFSQILILEYLW